MQTQPMQSVEPRAAWLERAVAGSDSPERTPLVDLPLTIGRVDTADLQINSTRVSREHALIVRQGHQYLLRDLGSTNGTFVNGVRIEEVVLGDGDVVIIADCEFTFMAAGEPSERYRATQAMTELASPARRGATDEILAVRRLQEQLLHRSLLPRLIPILDLVRATTFGFRVQPLATHWKGTDCESMATAANTNAAVARAHQLYRLMAAETFAELAQETHLILDIAPSEVERGLATEAHVMRLAHLVGPGRLIIGLPANAIIDDPAVREFRDRLKAIGLRLAYADFLGGRAQIQQLAPLAPDHLLLATNAAADVAANPRQGRQLAAIAETCNEIGCRAIVTGVRTRDEEDACLKLGLRLVASERQSRPASTSSPQPFAAIDDRAECLA